MTLVLLYCFFPAFRFIASFGSCSGSYERTWAYSDTELLQRHRVRDCDDDDDNDDDAHNDFVSIFLPNALLLFSPPLSPQRLASDLVQQLIALLCDDAVTTSWFVPVTKEETKVRQAHDTTTTNRERGER